MLHKNTPTHFFSFLFSYLFFFSFFFFFLLMGGFMLLVGNQNGGVERAKQYPPFPPSSTATPLSFPFPIPYALAQDKTTGFLVFFKTVSCH